MYAMDVVPPFKPEPMKVYINSVDKVGEFHEAQWRNVKLTEHDNSYYLKWYYCNRAHRNKTLTDLIRNMDLDEYGNVINKKSTTCCTIV